MKNIFTYLICAIILQLFSITLLHAQTVADLAVLKAPQAAITVDADLKEWGDSLRYFNAEANLRYAITNDKDNLYFAVRIDEPSEAARILKAGITFGIDPKGKKKAAYAITFPVSTQDASTLKPGQQINVGEITQADRDELHRELITNLRGIKVEGFKDVENEMITTSNSYGIKTAIDYDAKGAMVCEAAIPLKFFHLDEHTKAEWLFDIKINGVVRPGDKNNDSTAPSISSGGRGGRGGMGGGMGGMSGGRGGKSGGARQAAGASDTDGLSKSVDFSGKFFLVPVQ